MHAQLGQMSSGYIYIVKVRWLLFFLWKQTDRYFRGYIIIVALNQQDIQSTSSYVYTIKNVTVTSTCSQPCIISAHWDCQCKELYAVLSVTIWKFLARTVSPPPCLCTLFATHLPHRWHVWATADGILVLYLIMETSLINWLGCKCSRVRMCYSSEDVGVYTGGLSELR
jgi:hypothetical protein